MKLLKIHCFQHNPIEDLGNIKDWAIKNGHLISYTKFYEEFQKPNLEDIDFLVILGGEMGVHDEEKCPWLKQEKIFIQEAIAKKIKIFGICLGAQLIAEVLGSKVKLNPQKEIGWFPVWATEDAKKHPFFSKFEDSFYVFQWHQDTFEIPRQAIRLWKGEGCENQAFLGNDQILGLQFHLEFTKLVLKEMMENEEDSTFSGKYVQNRLDIFEGQIHITRNRQMMYKILDWFCYKK